MQAHARIRDAGQSNHTLSARGSAAFSVSETTILDLSESCWTSGIEAP
jgi:hypothetical protein